MIEKLMALILFVSLLTLPVFGCTDAEADEVYREVIAIAKTTHTPVRLREITNMIPNAFTDGRNIVVSGRLRRVATQDELRTVVFHEVGHCILRHLKVGMKTLDELKNSKACQEDKCSAILVLNQQREYEADAVSQYLCKLLGVEYDINQELLFEIIGIKAGGVTHPKIVDRIYAGHMREIGLYSISTRIDYNGAKKWATKIGHTKVNKQRNTSRIRRNTQR